ncbi:MAG: OmpA family protein [Bacteroidetes bacterium]|nr:OmpA family protein [Bacteroidota bacterium]
MKKLIIILFCLCNITLFAQKSQADKKFKLYEYSDAILLYKEYLEKSPADYEATRNLALSYKYTNNITGSIETYQSLVKLKQAVPDDWYELVQLLRINGNLADAKLYALQYQQKNTGEKAQTLLKSIDMYDELMSGKDNYNVINKTEQYHQSVFSPVYYQGGLMLTAENPEGSKNEWTGRGYTKLFLTDFNCSKLVPVASELMSKYNDGPAALSSDGMTMYFTTINKKSIQEQDVNTSKLQISAAVLKDNRWQPAELFRFNNNSYNVAHPTLRSDGNMLVFTSDKPGGHGGMDLYYCSKQPDNTWSEPINITILNTSGNEIFPSFDASGNLYYSSNGLPGLGGLDLFISKNEGSSFTAPANLKAPINSSYDDFSLATNNNLESGFISTNRFGSPEIDDIAYFSKKAKEVLKPAVKPIVKITVLDKYTATPLPYVSVTVKDDKKNIVFQGMTDPNGILMVEELPADNYRVQGILNEVTTTIASIGKEEFTKELIEKTITHNDPRFTLSGIATNASNDQPVAGVTVTCENTVLNKTNSRITTADGKFFFQLEQASDFKVHGELQGWLSSEAFYATTKGLDRSKDLYVKIKLSMQQPAANEVIRLDKIYYDYDKCDIKPRAAEELDRLVKLMNDFPDMKIELSSHTDSRGSNAYNQKLSQCRADAAVKYILGKGILKSRITAVGYGESRLVNGCSDGVNCTEKQHQENRRTEFKIVSCPSCPAIEKQ